MSRFHNPYNFIPLGRPMRGDLGQSRPAGHDCYQDKLWSGRITVQIETVTPLLVPDARGVETVQGDHKIFELRRDAHGLPLLPVTSLKGPLRAAYEAVTNSRLGVFKGHGAPPARRMAGIEGAAMVPARVVEDGNGFAIELWTGTSKGWPELQTARSGNKYYAIKDGNRIESVFAAWMPRYRKGKPGLASWATKDRSTGAVPSHGQEVFCWVEAYRHARKSFRYWLVREIASDAARLSSGLPPSAGHEPHVPASPSAFCMARGFVFVSEQNTENKHDERVFFVEAGKRPLRVALSDDDQSALSKRWTQLVENYQKLHEKEIAERGGPSRAALFLAPKPGKTAFSRHVFINASKTLARGTPFDPALPTAKVGTLCYARLVMRNGRPVLDAAGTPKIEDLYPVMISRELGHVSPERMVPDEMRPARALEELSPADRVFGWVNQSGKGAYKGQLRIRSVRCTSKTEDAIETFDPPLPLAILAAPKPAQARFYVGTEDGAPLPADCKTASGAYFEKLAPGAKPSSGLRGRKVYPHHATAGHIPAYWKTPRASAEATNIIPYGNEPEKAGTIGSQPLWREYVRRPGIDRRGQPIKSQDSQNRSIKAWVKPGAQFRAEIDVVNLNIAELGVLLWLLDLPRREGAGGPHQVPHHRLGGGKPLGFGSATIKVVDIALDTGAARRGRYAGLLTEPEMPAGIPERIEQGMARCRDGESGSRADTVGRLVDALIEEAFDAVKRDCGRNFRTLPHIQAFLQAARGYADGLPAHYPRTTPHPDPAGENFKWFGANEQNGQPLPAIPDDPGLPTTR